MDKINKAYLPFLILAVVAIGMFFYDPPHSICEDQLKSYRQSMIGKLYGRRVDKNSIPAKISEAVPRCQQGKSLGSCLDFFDIMNEGLTKLNQFEPECIPGLMEEKQIFDNSKKFFLIVNALAWGEKVPNDNRENWLSQANIFVYCKNKNFLKSVMEPEDFEVLVNRSIQSFPFEKLPFDFTEDSEEFINNKAINKLSTEEIIAKSLMSIRCENM